MADQGEAASEGSTTVQPTEERTGNTRPFICPNGSRHSSLDLENGDSTENLSKESSGDKNWSGSPEGSTPKAVDATVQADTHPGEKQGHREGAAKATPETETEVQKASDENGHPKGTASNDEPETVPTTSCQPLRRKTSG